MASRIVNFNARSVIAGAFFALTVVLLLGADDAETSKPNVLQKRFLVLESTPTGRAGNGYQSVLLKVCPHYGKIDQDSLKFRLASETQEINMILSIGEGYEIRRGDIIGFESFQHLKLSPGSKVVRHLRSGGQELVP